jgi:hypothetical protein
VIEGGRSPVPLVAPLRDAELRRQGVQLFLIVGQQMRPPVLPIPDGGPLPPIVDVDRQRRAQGRSRRNGVGLFHQRPLKRQDWCTGSCSSGAAGCGHDICTAAVMTAMTSGSGTGRGRSDSWSGSMLTGVGILLTGTGTFRTWF